MKFVNFFRQSIPVVAIAVATTLSLQGNAAGAERTGTCGREGESKCALRTR